MHAQRDQAHRRTGKEVVCSCGAKSSLLHISWDCPQYQHLRRSLRCHMLDLATRIPTCFKAALLVPTGWHAHQTFVEEAQKTITDIWSLHINAWHQGTQGETLVEQGAL
eukprot:11748341-Prorocentrum_lima.AAC.1